MTGPEHYVRAEELAAEAHRLLGQGDGQATAGVWAAVAQTHAVLALAAATAIGASGVDDRAVKPLAAARLNRAFCCRRAFPARADISGRLGLTLPSAGPVPGPVAVAGMPP